MADSTKRKPPAAGKGRPKGAKNKLTRSAKEAFQHAFDANGGAEGLRKWAQANPTDFYKLYARLIPVEHEGNVTLTFEDRLKRLMDSNDG